jgi:putative ABC transport system substrate-binding protein
MRWKRILLNGITRAGACHQCRRPSIPWATLTNGLSSSTIGGSATVPGCLGILRPTHAPVSRLTSRESFTYRANNRLDPTGEAPAGQPARCADIGTVGARIVMRRNIARLIIGVVLVIAPYGVVDARAAEKPWMIGWLDQREAGNPFFEAFRQGLRDLGWVEGQTIKVEALFAEGKADRLPALAAELVRLKMDVIVTNTTPAALAAKQSTKTIPIVFGGAADPVGNRIASGLAHHEGNITGWTHLGLELRAKYLELLKEAVPEATRFGVLWNPTNQVHKPSLKIIEGAAERLKVQLHLVGIQDPSQFEEAFTALVGKDAQALVVFPDGMFLAQTPLIVSLAARNRLPPMYGISPNPQIAQAARR